GKVEPVIYEGVDMQTVRYRIVSKIDGYIPLHKRWVLVLKLQGGTLFGKENYLNELFKIGGMSTLQGFDEESIYASSYAIGTSELRFLFAKKSYLNLFFNGAWYEQKRNNYYIHDTPYGFGLGFSFDTKAGMFYLSYALGKQFNNPISFKTGKIHFGIKVGF
ncbi:MAG: BamA/TamA family outer membrane protein, partial [Bacteroidales bacterium]